jgi:hypothetical protein
VRFDEEVGRIWRVNIRLDGFVVVLVDWDVPNIEFGVKGTFALLLWAFLEVGCFLLGIFVR